MAKKEGDESPSPSRRDPRVYGQPQKTVVIKIVKLTGKEGKKPKQHEGSIPTEGEGQQQAQ